MSEAPRVALLNAEETRGGAARAANRLLRGLRAIGVDCRMLVQRRQGTDPSVLGPTGPATNFLRAALDLAPGLLYPRRDRRSVFYPGWLPDRMAPRVRGVSPDVVHLHWITRGFTNVQTLRAFGRPIVWTLHDMWAFTGGCHYDNGCGKHERACGACPVLGSMNDSDLSRRGWQRKKRAYRDLPLTLVAPSNWIQSLVVRSSLLSQFPVHVIPNGIDTGVFHPGARNAGRKRLGIGDERKVILFGAANAAADPRKGMQYLEDALRVLASGSGADALLAVVFGTPAPRAPPDLGLQVVYPGVVAQDSRLAELYAAADVFVAPSLQENLSNTVMEALACGTPCVAFDVGGMIDMIEHRHNGFLARPGDSSDLAEGIRWVLEDERRRLSLADRARRKATSEYDLAHIASRHLALYQSILPGTGAAPKE